VAAPPGAGPAVLVVLDKAMPTAALLDAVRRRAAAAPTAFGVLVPNPVDIGFDDTDGDLAEGEDLLSRALPPLREAAGGGEVSGRVAGNPNAYDDIVAELDAGEFTEIILETRPAHLSKWLHVDLHERVSRLGLPTEAVSAT
jgi:hypothetical protein